MSSMWLKAAGIHVVHLILPSLGQSCHGPIATNITSSLTRVSNTECNIRRISEYKASAPKKISSGTAQFHVYDLTASGNFPKSRNPARTLNGQVAGDICQKCKELRFRSDTYNPRYKGRRKRQPVQNPNITTKPE
ncbi:hypothetical protein F5B22DRAFT_650698 [Xylaria bambusicola]|uniref:uncharacterized protein n=1 Tax=Xylaria bambusicola TaxID=326684 RepID=UPI0020087502|nr:uncharacterized protein F5B22DRAFT_650698 [Xylaria bambusicola]KAI0506447.1 hypothetical protein F5B22DRAFT_650698 [Xylaria bambusicola]